jgi:sulfoxide reductase heme-binding subunit YedZ
MRAWLLNPNAKRVLIALCFVPFTLYVYKALSDGLGPNPAEALIRGTGDWSIRLLCVVLLVTPLRVLTNTPALIRMRRIIGLSVFAYATLHLLCYCGFDMEFEWDDIVKDIIKRPFILVGFLGWFFLSLMALSSNNFAIKGMGVKRWQQLHQLVYAVVVTAVIHFYWMKSAKHNYKEVMLYAAILGSLLLWRLLRALKARLQSN